MIDALRKVVKRLHYPVEVMLICARWYAAYPLSLRHIEEMMAERGSLRRSLHRPPLVGQDPAGPGFGVSKAQAPCRPELAHG